MSYKKITNFFDTASKTCAVLTAPAIVLSTAATVVLFPLTVFLGLFSGNLKEKFHSIIRNPIAIVFLCFFSMFLLGVFYSSAPSNDILLMFRKYGRFLLAVMLFPLFIEEKWRERAVLAFMIGIFVMFVSSYLRFYGYLHWWTTGAVGMFKPSIEFNFLMAFAAYVCLVKITLTERYRWLWILFLVLIVHTVFFRSMGRTGYVVFAGLLALFFFQKLNWKGLVLSLIGIALLSGSAYMFSSTFKRRIDEAISNVKIHKQNNQTSVGLRMTFVENSLKLIKKNPIVGTGTGSFATEYEKVRPTPKVLTKNPHNEYLYITVQFGIIGLLILLTFFGVPLWYSQFLSEEMKYLARGAVVSIMIGSLANSWLLDITEGYFYAYFIAMLFAALPIKRNKLLRVGSDI